jgi:hypothetical protein
MTAAEFIAELGPKARAQKDGAGWKCCCPAHDDKAPSLSVTDGNGGRLLIHCHAGCTPAAVCEAAGLTMADLMPPRAPGNGKINIVASYDYRDEAGALLFQVCRMDPKDFRQRKPDGKGGWLWKLGATRRVPYRLPEVLAAVKDGRPVFIAEGEKDVAALEAAGFAATCNPGGAGKWLPEFAPTFQGAAVVIIADKDKPGREHAAAVASQLYGTAAAVKVLELPDLDGRPVKDAADYFTAGGQAADLDGLAEEAPPWTPPATSQRSAVEIAFGTSFDEITAELRAEIIRLLTDPFLKGTARARAVAKLAVGSLVKVGRLYYHAERKDFDSVCFFDGTAKRLLRIRSDAFAAWLAEWLAINRADVLFKFALSEIETAALAGPDTTGILPESFWTARPGALYVSNGDGAVARITADRVATVDNGTDGVLFAAGRTLAHWRLTDPRDPFETCALFRNAHSTAGHALDLLRLWLYSLPTSPRSKPPLVLAGEIGSGKTRLAKGCAELYGVPFVAAKVEEGLENNFWPCCDAGGIFTLDNADSKCRWLADALAAAATDGCSQRRRLYTDSETITLHARAWLAVTSANPSFAADAGLADRLLLVRMARRDAEQTSDAALTDEILAARDAGLSHIAETLRAALGDTAPTPARLNQRHPDFAAFAVKIGRALGREAEAIAALQNAEADKAHFCLENDSIGSALLAYLSTAGGFTGTAAELAPHLIAMDGELADRCGARRLSKRLSALWPHLQATLATAKREETREKTAIFTLKSQTFAGFAGFQRLIS